MKVAQISVSITSAPTSTSSRMSSKISSAERTSLFLLQKQQPLAPSTSLTQPYFHHTLSHRQVASYLSTDVLSPVHPPRKYAKDGGGPCSALCWLLGTWTPAGTQEELSTCQRMKETCLYGTTNHDLIELPNLGTDA